jgi:hypothetical protein
MCVTRISCVRCTHSNVHDVHQQRAPTTHLSCATRTKRTRCVRSNNSVCTCTPVRATRTHTWPTLRRCVYLRICSGMCVHMHAPCTVDVRHSGVLRDLHAHNSVRARCPVICASCMHTQSCVREAICARRAHRACVMCITRISRVRCTHSNVHSVHQTACVDHTSRVCYTHTYIHDVYDQKQRGHVQPCACYARTYVTLCACCVHAVPA